MVRREKIAIFAPNFNDQRMKKILYILSVAFLLASAVACNDTQTYADLVANEEQSIDHLITSEGFSVTSIDEETMKDWTKKILKDSINPTTLIKKDQWYTITEGDFKRLYFKVNKWGAGYERWEKWQAYQDSVKQSLAPKYRPDSVSLFDGKMTNGSYVLLRYDSLYLLSDTVNIHNQTPVGNLDPYSYQIIYGWSEYYYASYYYQYQYGSNSSYSCTSGGLAFPIRFLWYDSEVSLIVPFSLVPSDYSSYYYTLYYGKVKYSKPNYLPE